MSRTGITRLGHHLCMILRLDPRHPALWRTPHSLQFGVDAPPVVLQQVSKADERMISALAIGVTRPGLSVIGLDAGATEQEVAGLIETLRPVLQAAVPPRSQSVALAGSGRTVDGIAACLGEAGVHLRMGYDDRAARSDTDLAIIVAHYTIAPELYGFWLRRDVPHLPVILGDTAVQIGPIVEPGIGPCLYCVAQRRTDTDPAWPAIVSQLWGRRSPAESALVAGEVAALVSRLALSRLDGSPRPTATSIHLDAATGQLSRRKWLRHPECACAGIRDAQPAGEPARPGTSTAAARRRAVARPAPRTGAAVSARG